MGLFSVAVLVAILIDEIEVRKREERRRTQNRRILQELPVPNPTEPKDLMNCPPEEISN
jgi:uncharacterized membrane-anchored protein